MTREEVFECFAAGVDSLNFPTPSGKQRDISRLKWSTLLKCYKKAEASKREEWEEVIARKERIDPISSDMPHDSRWYKHSPKDKLFDRKRTPTTYKFPMLNLERMYLLWHCGDDDQQISAMKYFNKKDVAHVARGIASLSEVRKLMGNIDLEARKRGMEIKDGMTPSEAIACLRAGYPGLGIPPKTPDGRPRDILRMKWSSAANIKGTWKGSDVNEAEEISEAEKNEED